MYFLLTSGKAQKINMNLPQNGRFGTILAEREREREREREMGRRKTYM
jgi:hypothetical protein